VRVRRVRVWAWQCMGWGSRGRRHEARREAGRGKARQGRGKAVATKCSRSWAFSVAIAGVDAGYRVGSFVAR
jgi:hypothetical protein